MPSALCCSVTRVAPLVEHFLGLDCLFHRTCASFPVNSASNPELFSPRRLKLLFCGWLLFCCLVPCVVATFFHPSTSRVCNSCPQFAAAVPGAFQYPCPSSWLPFVWVVSLLSLWRSCRLCWRFVPCSVFDSFSRLFPSHGRRTFTRVSLPWCSFGHLILTFCMAFPSNYLGVYLLQPFSPFASAYSPGLLLALPHFALFEQVVPAGSAHL